MTHDESAGVVRRAIEAHPQAMFLRMPVSIMRGLLEGYEAAKKVIVQDERRYKVLANARAYIKPNTGAFNTILCGIVEIQNWRGNSVTPDNLKDLLSMDESGTEPGGEGGK